MFNGTTLLLAITILTINRMVSHTKHAAIGKLLLEQLTTTLLLAGNRREDIEAAIADLDEQLHNATQ